MEKIAMKWSLGPVADPAPLFRVLWERFAEEQRNAVLSKAIDLATRQTQIDIDMLQLRLETFEIMRSMIKGRT